ncbi:MAG: hypothetical protein U5K00_03715 [Melioribacteraceae bacterium]|nr:hypothetical protein [Melioribacteraceae bacterium]
MSKHTLSGMITSSGQQFVDWSSAYRLFQGSRINIDYLFSVLRKSLLKQKFYVDDKNIYSHMDDTILKKTGKKIVGTSWRRDPLGPPFHTNFIGSKISSTGNIFTGENREVQEVELFR